MEVGVVTFFPVRKIPLGRNTGLSLRLKISRIDGIAHARAADFQKRTQRYDDYRLLTHNFESRSPLFI